MGTNKRKRQSKKPNIYSVSGQSTKIRKYLKKIRDETDNSICKDDLQVEEEENAIEDVDEDNGEEEAKEGEQYEDEEAQQEESRKKFVEEPAWTEFRKGSEEDQVKRCRAVCKIASSLSLRNKYNIPADLQLDKRSGSWASVYKKYSDWSEWKKRTWAVYLFFRSVDSKDVEEVMLTIGKRGRTSGSTYSPRSNFQDHTASMKADANEADANEAARLIHIRSEFAHLFKDLNKPYPDRATLDDDSSGSAQLETTLWARIAKEFFSSENTYENACKDGMCTAELKVKVDALNPNKFRQRAGVSPGSWIQGAWEHVVSCLSLHWSAWNVLSNDEAFSPDAWHAFEVGHKSRAKAADHNEMRGTSPAHSNTCSAVCLYAPFVFTTHEDMYAIFASNVQIDSEKEGRSDTVSSPTISTGNSEIDEGMQKMFMNLADAHNRFLQAVLQDNTRKEASNMSKLRLYLDILNTPNLDEVNKVRVNALVESVLELEMKELENRNNDANN